MYIYMYIYIHTCVYVGNRGLLKLIRTARLILWDESVMMDVAYFEGLNEILNYASGDNSAFFGNKLLVLGGDWRQILPFVHPGRKENIISRILRSSSLWKNVKVRKLTQNMRSGEHKRFAKWLLKVGEGITGNYVKVPKKMRASSMSELIHFVHPQPGMEVELRSILCPWRKYLDEINEFILNDIQGKEEIYLSSNSVVDPSSCPINVKEEELAQIDVSGMAEHRHEIHTHRHR